MNDRARELIDAAARRLAGKVRPLDQVRAELYQLVIDCASPAPSASPGSPRRSPGAGEVLPPHQRASWARERTVHDG
jgi:hypothetical protein